MYNLAINNATALRRALQVDVRDALFKEYTKAFRDNNYVRQIRGKAITFIVLSIIIFIILMIILLILLCIANAPPAGLSRGLRILAQFIIIVQLIFAILVLILGISSIFAGVYMFYGCEVIDGIINNRNYIQNNLTKAHSNYPALNTLANECVFKGGSGFLINSLGTNNIYFDLVYQQFDNVFTG